EDAAASSSRVAAPSDFNQAGPKGNSSFPSLSSEEASVSDGDAEGARAGMAVLICWRSSCVSMLNQAGGEKPLASAARSQEGEDGVPCILSSAAPGASQTDERGTLSAALSSMGAPQEGEEAVMVG